APVSTVTAAAVRNQRPTSASDPLIPQTVTGLPHPCHRRRISQAYPAAAPDPSPLEQERDHLFQELSCCSGSCPAATGAVPVAGAGRAARSISMSPPATAADATLPMPAVYPST